VLPPLRRIFIIVDRFGQQHAWAGKEGIAVDVAAGDRFFLVAFKPDHLPDAEHLQSTFDRRLSLLPGTERIAVLVQQATLCRDQRALAVGDQSATLGNEGDRYSRHAENGVARSAKAIAGADRPILGALLAVEIPINRHHLAAPAGEGWRYVAHPDIVYRCLYNFDIAAAKARTGIRHLIRGCQQPNRLELRDPLHDRGEFNFETLRVILPVRISRPSHPAAGVRLPLGRNPNSGHLHVPVSTSVHDTSALRPADATLGGVPAGSICAFHLWIATRTRQSPVFARQSPTILSSLLRRPRPKGEFGLEQPVTQRQSGQNQQVQRHRCEHEQPTETRAGSSIPIANRATLLLRC